MNDLTHFMYPKFADTEKSKLIAKFRCAYCHLIKFFLLCNTVKTLYTDTLYNSKILHNVSSICTNVPV